MTKPFFIKRGEEENVNDRFNVAEHNKANTRNDFQEGNSNKNYTERNRVSDRRYDSKYETLELIAHRNFIPVATEQELNEEDDKDNEGYELIKCANCERIFKIKDEPIPQKCPVCGVSWERVEKEGS